MPRPDTLSTALGLLEYKTRIEVPPPGLYANADEALLSLQAAMGAQSAENSAQLDAKCQLAVLCLELQLRDQAMQLLQETAEGRTRLLGLNDPATLVAKELISYVLVGQSRYSEAQTVCEAVYHGRINSLGEQHRSTLQSRFNLALLAWFLGSYDEAINRMKGTSSDAQAAFGEGDRFAILTLQNLSYMLHLEARDAEATAPARQALQQLASASPPDDGEILKTAILAAAIYGAMEWWRERLAMYRIAVEKREALQGRDHIATIDSLSNLAAAFAKTDDYESAENTYSETTGKLRIMFGAGHPRVMKEEIRLAHMYMYRDKLDDALAMVQDVLARLRVEEDPALGAFAMEVKGATLCRLDRRNEAIAVLNEGQALRDGLPVTVDMLLQSVDTAHLLLTVDAVEDAERIVCEAIDKARTGVEPDEKLDEALKKTSGMLTALGKTTPFNKFYGLE